jgi:hypothetical protein
MAADAPLSEYDVRQLKRILQKVSDYNNGDITLGMFVNDLEALVNCLEGVPEDLVEALRSVYVELEIRYAGDLDESYQSKDPLIARAVESIDTTVSSFLSRV